MGVSSRSIALALVWISVKIVQKGVVASFPGSRSRMGEESLVTLGGGGGG